MSAIAPVPDSRADTTTRGRPPEIKLARRIAQRLEADILASDLPIGEVFASENDLRMRYGGSREVVREAIRLVEHHGLAQMRRGPYGGLVLRAPDSGPLTTAIVIYLEYVGTSVEDLLAARLLLEPYAARLSAHNLDEDGVAAIREALANEQARTDLTHDGRDPLHVLLAAGGGNKVLELFINVLLQLTQRYVRIPALPLKAELAELAGGANRAHERIAEAVIAIDPAQAERRMIRHLERLRDWFSQVGQEPIRQHSSPRTFAPERAAAPKEKLPEAVARTVMAEIARNGLQPGDIYCSEPELIARLGVSRAVFRAAVRLLEYHSIARMRRGTNGGLVIAKPDPSASVEAMAVYLDYERVGAAELREVRNIIELGAVATVVSRIDDPVVATALQQADCVNQHTPGEQVRPLAHDFHMRMVELAGNPILSLFLRIVVALWERHSAHPALQTSDSAAIAAEVSHAHHHILDAILAKDLPLARHRMNRHLEALDSWWE